MGNQRMNRFLVQNDPSQRKVSSFAPRPFAQRPSRTTPVQPAVPRAAPQFSQPADTANGGAGHLIQMKGEAPGNTDAATEPRPNQTGLPNALKAGVNNLSCSSSDNGGVHYYSPKPAQVQALAYNSSVQLTDSLVQRALREDFEHDNINMAIVGEQHGEISPEEEIDEWGRVNVKVRYEFDKILHRSGPGGMLNANNIPDPPILRATFLWAEFNVKLRDFWRKVIAGEDINGLAMSVKDVRNIYGRVSDELQSIGPVALEIVEMENAIESMFKLPPTSDDLMARDEGVKKIIGQEQLSCIAVLDVNMKRIWRQSSFSGTEYDKDELMIERSRQMILNANKVAPGVKRVVYKVGNEHISDIALLGIAPVAGLKVLGRTGYLSDYASLKNFNADDEASGNAAAFGQIGNKDL